MDRLTTDSAVDTFRLSFEKNSASDKVGREEKRGVVLVRGVFAEGQVGRVRRSVGTCGPISCQDIAGAD